MNALRPDSPHSQNEPLTAPLCRWVHAQQPAKWSLPLSTVLRNPGKKYISCIAGVLSVHKLTFERLRVCLCSFNVVAKAHFIISLVDMFSQDFAKVSKGQTATSWSCSSSNLRACDMGTLEEALELCVSGIQPYANTAHDGRCNRALMPIP